MEKIRVLIVDDAVVVRRLVADVLAADPQLEIAGTAANGKIALNKLDQVQPDVVILDMEMPEMDGLQTLKAIRQLRPRLPIIMFSTLTERGGMATLDALALGANDYVTKPANVGSVALAIQRVNDELVPKIKALCARPQLAKVVPKTELPAKTALNVARRLTATVRPKAQTVEVVAIGISTGGPNALADLLSRLPADFPVPMVIVQHMPPLFTKLLGERLNSKTPLQVREAAGGEVLRPGQVWLAPGGQHLIVERHGKDVRLRLTQEAPENFCRPAVDVLFRSVAQVYGAHTLALMMTGMGHDGLRGCEAIYQKGGQILAQDEASSVVWGMPGFVVQSGLADKVLPLAQLAGELVTRARPPKAHSQNV